MDKINCGVFLYSYNGLLHGIKMNEVELQASIREILGMQEAGCRRTSVTCESFETYKTNSPVSQVRV